MIKLSGININDTLKLVYYNSSNEEIGSDILNINYHRNKISELILNLNVSRSISMDANNILTAIKQFIKSQEDHPVKNELNNLRVQSLILVEIRVNLSLNQIISLFSVGGPERVGYVHNMKGSRLSNSIRMITE